MVTRLKGLVILVLAIAALLAVGWFYLNRRSGDERVERDAASRTSGPADFTTEGTKPLGKAPTNNEELPTAVTLWKMFIGETGEDGHRIVEVKYSGVATHTLDRGEGIDGFLEKVALGQEPAEWKPVTPPQGDAETYKRSPLSIRHDGYGYMVFVLDEKNWHFTAEHEPFAVKRGKEEYYVDPKCAWVIPSGTVKIDRETSDTAECKVASFISHSARDRRHPSFKTTFRSPFNFYVSLKLPRKTGGPLYLPLAIDPDVGYPGGNQP